MTTEYTMQERWYVMEIRGPYGWQIAQRTTGTYYDITQWFCPWGYETEDEAKAAIQKCLSDNGYLGPFFVLKGYV